VPQGICRLLLWKKRESNDEAALHGNQKQHYESPEMFAFKQGDHCDRTSSSCNTYT
jgi:hypothetical protein